MSTFTSWTDDRARAWVRVPGVDDDKYSRGVVGMVTGSKRYPGAAVLGVEAAVRAGAGMVRHLGSSRASELVLARRPEVVTAAGRVQAWVIGSGTDPAALGRTSRRLFDGALDSGLPVVVDAGALGDLATRSGAHLVATPHLRELARLLGAAGVATTVSDIGSAPETWAARAADTLGVTVLLKGAETLVASPGGVRLSVTGAPPWLATAGAGDVLAGVIGAIAAAWSEEAPDGFDDDDPARWAATAALLHGRAASIASRGGPIAALDVAEAIPDAVRALLAES